MICSISSTYTKRMRFPMPTEPKTFTELVYFVKTTPNIWDPNTSTLSKEFINKFKTGTEVARLDKTELNVLVDMISYRLPLSGNSENDKKIIQNYTQQKKYLLQGYASFTEQSQQLLPNKEIELFIQQLIDQEENKAALKYFADPNYTWRHGYTAETFGNLTSELKKRYPNSEDQAKAKSILINKIKEVSPNISHEGERWGQMLNFINLNIPYEVKPTKETIPSEEPQAQEPQPYSAEATKGKQPSQPDKDMIGDVEQIVEANRTYIENFIKLESFNNQDTFEVFAPITSALKEKYADIENQKKLKPILITTIKKLFPDQIGDLKMGSIYTTLNNNLP